MRRWLYGLLLVGIGALRTALLVVNAAHIMPLWYAEAAPYALLYAGLMGLFVWLGVAFLLFVPHPRGRVFGWIGFAIVAIMELLVLVPYTNASGSMVAGITSAALLVVAMGMGVQASGSFATTR